MSTVTERALQQTKKNVNLRDINKFFNKKNVKSKRQRVRILTKI